MNFEFQEQSPIDDLVTDITTSVILQPIIDSLEQIVVESNNVSEPNIMRHIGPNVQSVPCQMAIINLCQKTTDLAKDLRPETTTTVDTIIAEEASSTTYFLHEIGTKALVRCLEHISVDIILQIARGMIQEGIDSTTIISTASKSLSIAEQHLTKMVRYY